MSVICTINKINLIMFVNNIVALFLTVITIVNCGRHDVHAPGYSYAKFSGPVSGPEKEVLVADEHHGHGAHKVDYIAKPDYHFAYGVEDPKSKVSQNRKETRNGDAVQGEYSVVDPDGILRTVKYTADKHNGFQAQILTSGKAHGGDDAAPAHYVAHNGDSDNDDEYY